MDITSLTLFSCLFLGLFSHGVAIRKYEMRWKCGESIELDDDDDSVYIELVYRYTYPPALDCCMDISGDGHRLMLTFNYMNILIPDYLEIDYGEYKVKYWGYVPPTYSVSTSSSGDVKLHFVSDYYNNGLGFGLIINRVSKSGDCDFHCGNGYCIDKDLLCDSWNNCGDQTDEMSCGNAAIASGMSAWLVAIIVCVAVFIGVACLAVCCYCCGCCDKKKPPRTHPQIAMIIPPPMVAPPMVKQEGSPNAMYAAYAPPAYAPDYEMTPPYGFVMDGANGAHANY